MDLVRKIVAGAAERLTPDGILMVEIGNEREYAEAAFGHLGLTWLTTSAGDDMVFLLTAEQLQNCITNRRMTRSPTSPLITLTMHDHPARRRNVIPLAQLQRSNNDPFPTT